MPLHSRVSPKRIGLGLASALVLLVFAWPWRQPLLIYAARLSRGGVDRTVDERVSQYGEAARARLRPFFLKTGVAYPPKRIALLAFKDERELQLYAGSSEPLAFIRTFPILGASGQLGPKLRQGDMQVPEGLYRIESFNPNSLFHLSLRVNYPNRFDRLMAQRDGRTQLGGDIMIHGSDASIGCLAMGDEAIEDLFVLAAETGLSNIRVVISPVDLRRRPLPAVPAAPAWAPELYRAIEAELKSFALPATASASGSR